MPIIILIIVTVFSMHAQAQSFFTPNQTARMRAMGGTSVATARGVDGLFHNAAALARVEGYSLRIIGANAGASQNSQHLLDQNFSSGSALTASDLQALYGNTYFAEASAQSGMVFPNFGFGAYSSNYTMETFNNPVFPTFNVDFMSEYGYVVAAAIPVANNVSFGIAGRHMKRWSGNEDLLVTDLIGTSETDLIESRLTDKGTGEALDISFMATIAQDTDVALVWKDIGDTKYTVDTGNGPERQENNLALGISKVSKYTLVDLTYAFQYDHIRQDGDLSKKLHAGFEASFPLIDIRAGLNQGYVTYGVGVDLWILTIDATAYTEELGSHAGSNRSDRYQASVNFNLDFDQAFKLRSESGKKRRLMQRR